VAEVTQPSGDELDILGRFGGQTQTRFETTAFTGLQQNSFTEIGADTDPDLSPDGARVVFASTRHSKTSDIYLKRSAGRTVTRLTSDPSNDIQPTFSPDGRFVAYTSDRSGNWDVYVMSADGSKPFQVTNSLGHEIHPSWSPDGAQLCYSQYNSRTGRWEIWIVEVANPANRRFVAYGLYPTWCPSSSANRIAFQLARHRDTQLFSIWTVDLVDDEARYLTEVVPATADSAAIAPSWSPDGTSLVYTTVRIETDPKTGKMTNRRVERGDDIWVAAVDGSTRVRLTGDGTSDWCPAWAPDGRIYFSSNRSGIDNIWSLKPLDMKLIQATRVAPARVGSRTSPTSPSAAPKAAASVSANSADL
jgi:TolB protein